jgi:hypothetical protein
VTGSWLACKVGSFMAADFDNTRISRGRREFLSPIPLTLRRGAFVP